MALGVVSRIIIAVLGQFCVEVITQRLYPYTKCSCRISNKFLQKALNHKNVFGGFAGIALIKLEKVCQIFSCFNPCSSFQSLVSLAAVFGMSHNL